MSSERTFALAACSGDVYAPSMVTAVDASRGSQDETPFPLEFDIVAGRKRVVHREGRSQDETAPFPAEFEVVARKTRQSPDETSPFLLEFSLILPNGASAFVRTARPPRSRGARRSPRRGLPLLKWQGVNASQELRSYAARIAAGESLPPYRGPILEAGDFSALAAQPAASRAAHGMALAPSTPASDSKAFVKLGLALIVMSALVVASALLGDDAQLRKLGQSISDWFGGREPVEFLPSEPAAPR